MMESGSRADVIAYTTTQGASVAVQPHTSLCAFVPAKSESVPLFLSVFCLWQGWWCVEAASACAEGGALCAGFFLLAHPRTGPHVRVL